MTATVTLLASHRRNREQAAACPRCSVDGACAPHRLAQLATRLRAARGTDLQDEALSDALAVIEDIARQYLPADERTTR